MRDKACPHCNRPLMKIDHYGEVLIGCLKCNRWGWPGSDKPFMVLPDDMRTLISIFALTLAFAFTVPAFARDVTAAKKAEEQCQKDGGNWDGKTCSGKY